MCVAITHLGIRIETLSVYSFLEPDRSHVFPKDGNVQFFLCPTKYLLSRPIPEWLRQHIVNKMEYDDNADPATEKCCIDKNEWAV
jgi:hypothetical protein